MEDPTPVLIIFAGIGAVVLLVLAARLLALRKAAKAAISDDVCVACDSRALEWIADGAYRCMKCGYEGGSGQARIREEARLRRIEAMSPEARRESGIADLRDARMHVMSAQGTIAAARSLSTMDMAGLAGADAAREKQQEMANATTELQLAQERISDAAAKLDHPELRGPDLDIDFSSAAFGLDIHFDSLIGDLLVHDKIRKITSATESMLKGVEDALRRLGVPPESES